MSFKQLIDATMKHGKAVLAEKAPSGFEGTVKAMKKDGDVDNPYALAWWMKNKGYKSHKKASGADKESMSEIEGSGRDPIEDVPPPQWMQDASYEDMLDYGEEMRTLDPNTEQPEQPIRDPNEIKMQFDFDEAGGKPQSNGDGIHHTERAPKPSSGKKPQAGTERGRAYHKSMMKAQQKHDRKQARESIRVSHPLHGNGTVEEITESYITIIWDRMDKRITAPATLPFADAKYLSRLAEEYTDDVADAQVGNAKKNLKRVDKGIKKDMKKQTQKVDESMIAVGMAPIGGTHRGGTATQSMVDDIIRFEDLLEDGDDWKQPWNEDEGEDDSDGSAEGGEGSENHAPEKDTTKGADYTNVPRPADSILTNTDDQQSYSADPLSTKAGFDSAGDGSEPDGDYQDINPVDAPETPQIRDLEGSSDRGNTRDSGDSSNDTSEADAGDYDESKPEDDNGGENKMKNEAWLGAEDLGIDLTEMDNGYSDGYDDDYEDDSMNEHSMGEGEIAFTSELLDALLAAVSEQTPDADKLAALCAGLKSAQSDKGDSGLGVEDWDAIKSAAASAYSEGGDDMGDDDMGDDPVGDGEDDFGDEEFEDKAAGDGEVAGPEGGDEHEGKTKMMDCDGDMTEKKVDVDGKRPGRRNKDPRQAQSMKRRAPKRSQQLENKGSGTPVGTGSTSGSGGGNQTDLSKPKSYKGKPVGTGTSGAGGSNSNEFGQKPSKDGGSNNLPAYDSGSQLGAENTPFSNDAESPAPRSSKPLAAESAKNSRKKLDEAICLGMSSIPGVLRGDATNAPDDADWDDEMKLIKRRAGIEEWWKD